VSHSFRCAACDAMPARDDACVCVPAAWLGVFLQTVPESVLRDSVLRFSRTRGSGFLVRGACEDRMHDRRSIRAVRNSHGTLTAIHVRAYSCTRIAAAAIPRTSPPRIRWFVHGAEIIYLFCFLDKIWKPSRVCTVCLC
jgi:hypothetical protein